MPSGTQSRFCHFAKRRATSTRIAILIFWLAALALQGCSTNPTVSAGGTIQDFARSLDGQRYSFDLAGRVLTPSMSGELVTGQRIPKGLLVALAPAQGHCANDGGTPSFSEFQAAGLAQFSRMQPNVQAQLPRRMMCIHGDALLWVLVMQYGDLVTIPTFDRSLGNRLYLSMKISSQLLTADQFSARLRDEATAQRDRQAALEKERQQDRINDRERMAEARRVTAQWQARVTEFRANLKAGDRFKWVNPSRSGAFVGMVVRVEGALVFVQFENLTIGGQQTRYIARDQLEPFDGPTPGGRYEIE